jgi:hypothetical protein
MPNATFGLGFMHESGVNVAGPNSGVDAPAAPLQAGEGFVDYHLDRVPLQPGAYAVSAAIVDRGHIYDIADREFELRVRAHGSEEPGLTRFFGRWAAAVPVDPGSLPGTAEPVSSGTSTDPTRSLRADQ